MVLVGEVLRALAYVVTISVPEELFIVAFAFIIIKKSEYIEFSKRNLFLIMVPVLSVAVVGVALRTLVPSTGSYMMFISILLITVAVVLTYHFRTAREMLSVLIGVIISMATAGILQVLFITPMFSITGVDADVLNRPGILQYLWIIPERFVEYALLSYLIFRKHSYSKESFIAILLAKRSTMFITLMVFISNIAFLFISFRQLLFQQILKDLSLVMQTMITVAIIVFPLINIGAVVGVVSSLHNQEAKRRFDSQEELKVTLSDIRFFLKRNEYGRIAKELGYLEENTKELY